MRERTRGIRGEGVEESRFRPRVASLLSAAELVEVVDILRRRVVVRERLSDEWGPVSKAF